MKQQKIQEHKKNQFFKPSLRKKAQNKNEMGKTMIVSGFPSFFDTFLKSQNQKKKTSSKSVGGG